MESRNSWLPVNVYSIACGVLQVTGTTNNFTEVTYKTLTRWELGRNDERLCHKRRKVKWKRILQTIMKKRLYKDLRKIKINLFVNSFWTTQGFDKDKSFRQLVHIISPRTVSLQVSLLNSPLSEFLSDKCFHSHPIPLNILCHLAPRNVSDLPRPW